ncbi:MAG: TAT-variant-translocated molybdopterin oxidoreductase, partial [Candidatus Omnitrophica bacterium]|nr:TAT-variant-translocated molybdopterin oxidoreductase [Candidatus Omnitrophota bacterium]
MREQEQPNPVDISKLSENLQGKSGQDYWRSFEQAADTPEFKAWAKHEFPNEPEVWDRGTTRRDFLQLMGSMIALAGLAGCTRQPVEKIVPYVKQPEDLVPGRPLYYASAVTLDGYARGVLVESHMGRPTKIEGNPAHPDGQGAADSKTQASVLGLYDPDRSKTVLQNGQVSTWTAFAAAVTKRLDIQRVKEGEGLRVLTRTVVSPTLAAQLSSVLKQFPKAKWIQYSPVNRDNAREGAIRFFGSDFAARYHVDAADVILALDSDFLNDGPGSLRYAREFASRRKARGGKILKGKMNRLYSVESSVTLTGSSADHRLPLASSRIEALLVGVAAKLGLKVKADTSFTAEENKWISAVAKDLGSNKGRSLIIAGDAQPASVHALTHALNRTLSNNGKTVVYTKTIEPVSQAQTAALRELAADLEAGKVDDLFMLDSNPVYDAPADLIFSEKITRAAFRAHLGSREDETGVNSHWHVPSAHYLESWSDARAFDGTVSLIQPLIQPLYGAKSAIEVAMLLEGKNGVSAHDRVQEYWKSQGESGIDWDKSLHDGVVAGTAFEAQNPEPSSKPDLRLSAVSKPADGVEVNFRPDPMIGDGTFANNAWLQEMPKPITRITWENIIAISPATAEKIGISKTKLAALDAGGRYAASEIIWIDRAGRVLEGPAWIVPGHADDSVTVYLGYGRSRAGKIGDIIGYNAYSLRASDSPDQFLDGNIGLTGKRTAVASTQDHGSMEDRHLVREATAAEYAKHPDFAAHLVHTPKPNETLFKTSDHLKGENQWGMSIDLNTCIGCGACTTACQSENNIPVVGKKNVLDGREMHWIRVDRYFEGEASNPRVVHQPVPCMQCENAPCEPVCPVGATTHSSEGLNDMVYNRCVGTRYCANNCAYKVRRFNFYNFVDDAPSLKLLRNPDVTVRTRGVMEKCTYCVQRINLVRIEAKKEDRPNRDGEIVTACQQTCPTQAINFG